MTRQQFWDPAKLRLIRRGIEIGQYHARFPFGRRYAEILAKSKTVELTYYERGLLAGFESAARESH